MQSPSATFGSLPLTTTGLQNYARILEKVDNASSGIDIFSSKKLVVGDMSVSEGRAPHYTIDYTPTLTRTRAGEGGLWIFAYHRMLTTSEIEGLQGLGYVIKKGNLGMGCKAWARKSVSHFRDISDIMFI